jgi:putative membrane protein
MSVSTAVFWGLVLWAGVVLFRRFDRGRPDRSDPERILAQRYAAGQIDEQEYRHRLQVLRESRRSAAGRLPAP